MTVMVIDWQPSNNGTFSAQGRAPHPLHLQINPSDVQGGMNGVIAGQFSLAVKLAIMGQTGGTSDQVA